MDGNRELKLKRALAAATGLLWLALLAAAWRLDQRPAPYALTPALTGQAEYCLTCHGDLPEISPSHPVAEYGCVRCHGGERLALDADLAHSTLRGGRNPSDLAVAEASCGGPQCHSGAPGVERDHIARVLTSLHTTYSGAITAARYAYGAQPDLRARFAVAAVEDAEVNTPGGLAVLAAFDPAQEPSPVAQSFAQNCMTCHLRAEPRPGAEYARFTGCAACHAPAPGEGQAGAGNTAPVHRLGTDIPYTRCNACHNRGRYSAATMQFEPRTDQPASRPQDYYPPGTPHALCEVRLDCIDCHTRREVMGDGDLHGGMSDEEYVQCRTCHGTLTEEPLAHTVSDPKDVALRLLSLNSAMLLRIGGTALATERGETLWNTRRLGDGSFELIDKATAQHFRVPLVKGSGCKQDPDEQDARACHVCHATRP